MVKDSEVRRTYHLKARMLMNSGQHSNAIALLHETLQHHGEHIFIYIDLAACYYMIKEYYLFKEYALLSQKKFDEFKCLLSDESFVLSSIGIGRFLEELGLPIEALQIYHCTLERIHLVGLPISSQVHAQRLRLKSFLGIDQGFYEDYIICQKALDAIKDQLQSISKIVDLSHALIMADHYKGSRESAREKVRKVLSYSINESERNLVVVDHISEILSSIDSTETLNQDERQFLKSLEYDTCDPFEKAIVDLSLQDKLFVEKYIEMSLHGALKYLLILRKRNLVSQKDALSFNAYFALTLNRFEKKSRNFIRRRWNVDAGETSLTIEKVKDSVVVSSFDGRSCSFRYDCLNGRLLLLASNIPNDETVSVDHVIEEIYGESLSVYGFEKLRKAVDRLNESLYEKLGVEKAVQINKAGFLRRA